MHVKHIVVVSADNASDAYSEVKSELEKYLNSGFDYFTILGSIDTHNKIHIKDTEYKDLFKRIKNIETANKTVINWIKAKGEENNDAKALMAKHLSSEELDDMGWYYIEQYAKYQHQLLDLKASITSVPNSVRMLKKLNTKNTSFIQEFDVLKHTFYAYNFCECGVTHIGNEPKNFIVIVDCHY